MTWTEANLPTILGNYKLDQIYGADEFGLFHQAHPDHLHLKNESCVGGKHSKVRLTGLTAANALGDKLPMFVIGKSKKPRCFIGLKHLPCRYRNQKKSWMDSILIEEWVREIDEKFASQGKKIVLVLDNCPAHPPINDLKSTNLVFFPPNTTSKVQPMNQSIIRSLKARYRVSYVSRLIEAIDKKELILTFSILDAMKMLDMAWESIPKQVIVNCLKQAFRKTNKKLPFGMTMLPFKSSMTS